MIKVALLLVLVLAAGTVFGQVNRKHREGGARFAARLAEFASFGKGSSPTYNLLPANTATTTGQGYWSSSSYRTVSDDGRFQSVHTFDTMGNLRESRASFSLGKRSVTSWKIQISPQRNRPWLSYIIH